MVTAWYDGPWSGDGRCHPITRTHESSDFGRLWVGQGLTAAGTQVTALALPLTAILLHASAGAVGMLNALQWAPFLVLSLVVGIVVDRHRRRPLLMAGNAVRATALGGIVYLAYTGHLTVVLLLALVFMLGCGAVLFELALPAYVPSLVGVGDLMGANQRLQSAATGAQLGGPVAAGLLVQVLSAPLTLLLNGLGFVGATWAFGAIRRDEAAPSRPGTRPWAELRAGVGFTWSHRSLRSLIPVSASYNLFNEWLLTVYVVYAVRDLALSPFLIGVTLAGGTVGAFAGAKASDAMSKRVGLGGELSLGGRCGVRRGAAGAVRATAVTVGVAPARGRVCFHGFRRHLLVGDYDGGASSRHAQRPAGADDRVLPDGVLRGDPGRGGCGGLGGRVAGTVAGSSSGWSCC